MPRTASPVQGRLLDPDSEHSFPPLSSSSSSGLSSLLSKLPYYSSLSSQQRKLALCLLCSLLLFLVLYRPFSSHCPYYPPLSSPASLLPQSAFPTNILVTGGAGYIGSHFSLLLFEQSALPFNIVAVDDLSRGSQLNFDTLSALSRPHWSFTPVRHDCGDTQFLASLLTQHNIQLVVHFAGFAYASESVAFPLLYFDNIVTKTQGLLAAMQRAAVDRLIYSSSSATYGQPVDLDCDVPIQETTPQRPVSPYGRSKLMAEQVIEAYQVSQQKAGLPFSYAAMRYFNVIGGDAKQRVGAMPKPELRNFSRVVDACFDAALEARPMPVYGSDYATEDGSAIRDYIHVWDLVRAHLAVVSAVHHDSRLMYNVGIGRGFSNKELVAACSKATNRKVDIKWEKRRDGDPALVLGDAAKISRDLSWRPEHTDLSEMIETAWRWRLKWDALKAEGKGL